MNHITLKLTVPVMYVVYVVKITHNLIIYQL